MPIAPIAGAIAAPLAGALVGKAVGGGGAKNAQSATPKDLQGMRGSNIGLLQYLLGFNEPNAPWNAQGSRSQSMPNGGQSQQGGGVGVYGPGGKNGWGGAPGQTGPWGGMQPGMQPNIGPSMDPGRAGFNPQGMMEPGRMPLGAGGFGAGRQALTNQAPGMGWGGTNDWSRTDVGSYNPGGPSQSLPGNNPLGRIESYFGPLGTPTTALQQQSLGGISQFLNSNPYGQSNNALSGILGTKPQDYFGGAQKAYGNVAGSNFFGGAQDAFKQLQGGNYYGDAKSAFQNLQNYNPFQPAQTALEGMFAQNPGQGMLDALRPSFDRNLAAANQQGGRFGSANAILRSRAVDDYNLLGAQALQHGIDQQIAAAGQYGTMGNGLINARLGAGQGLLGVGNGQMQQQSNAAQGLLGVGQGRLDQGLGVANGLLGIGNGRSSYANQFMGNQINAAGQMGQNANNLFGNLQGAYNTGGSQAVQEAQRQQQALAILQGMLGTSQQASLGGPTVVQPTGAQQGLQAGMGLAQILAMSGQGRGGPQNPAGSYSNPGQYQPGFGIPYGF